ncbi:hypothetical protein CC80DRAFT_588061 [Byssothecium circinans]|uniref:Uncharacterized protein n=1 Tax=Byssothecium circinans TaxID=147558 RepID=A0A6A5URJ6_9PLEO|nr:hypothetical protein CC80DRAFT_588061 [Byssothecium circinans]
MRTNKTSPLLAAQHLRINPKHPKAIMSSVQEKYQPWKEFFPTKAQLTSTVELCYDPVSAQRNFGKPWRMWMKDQDIKKQQRDTHDAIDMGGGAGSDVDDATWCIITGEEAGSDDVCRSNKENKHIVTSGAAGTGGNDAIWAIKEDKHIVTTGAGGNSGDDAA